MAEVALVALGFWSKVRAIWTQHPGACLMAAALVATGVGGAYVGGRMMAPKVAAARTQAAVAQAGEDQAKGQVVAGAAAAAIAATGAQHVQLDISTHQENVRAISQAPGAGAGVAPALNDAGRRGLCRYSVYAGDPDCAGLRGADPAIVPPADQGNSAPGS